MKNLNHTPQPSSSEYVTGETIATARMGMQAVFAVHQLGKTSEIVPERQPFINAETGEEVDLYERIIDARLRDSVELVPKIKRLVIDVLDDKTLSIRGRKVPLEGNSLYALNSLLLNSEPRSPGQLAQFGFDSALKVAALGVTLNGLAKGFKRLANDDVILSAPVDGERFFCLSPYVKFADARQMKEAIALHEDVDIDPLKLENDIVAQESDMRLAERNRKIQAIVKQFRNNPQVRKKINKYFMTVQPRGLEMDEDWLEKPTKKFPLLDGADEQALFRIIDEGLSIAESAENFKSLTPEQTQGMVDLTTAHTIVYVSNLRLVGAVARSLTPYGRFPLGDIVQAGNIKMGEAIGNFDYKRGYKFSVLARMMIRQGVLREQARMLGMPRRLYGEWLKINGATNHFYHQTHTAPSAKQLEALTGISAEKIPHIQVAGDRNPYSLDEIIEKGARGGVLDDKSVSFTTITDRIVAKDAVRQIFASEAINPRQKLILALRHGIFDHLPPDLEVSNQANQRINIAKVMESISTTDGLTFEEIAAILGLTKQRVHQIEVAALTKLREKKT